jgi:hypothetical protein
MNRRGQRISLETLLGLIIIAIAFVGFFVAADKVNRVNNYDQGVFEDALETFELLSDDQVLGLRPFKKESSGLAIFNYDKSLDYTLLPDVCNDKTCICLYDAGKSQFEDCRTFGKAQFYSSESKSAKRILLMNSDSNKYVVIEGDSDSIDEFSQVDTTYESIRINGMYVFPHESNSHSVGKRGSDFIICSIPSDCREDTTT